MCYLFILLRIHIIYAVCLPLKCGGAVAPVSRLLTEHKGFMRCTHRKQQGQVVWHKTVLCEVRSENNVGQAREGPELYGPRSEMSGRGRCVVTVYKGLSGS